MSSAFPDTSSPLSDETPATGLSSAQAAQRLAEEGPNDLPRQPPRTAWRILREVAREPLFQLLAAALAIYMVLGETSEAAVLLGFLAVIVAITVVQERRTERVLEALHDMTSPRALVWRDGRAQRVAGRELVRSDRIALAEGDRVPADARLLEAGDLAVDESLLSGESLPVAKSAGGQAPACMVWAGTLVVSGQGVAQVTATGAHSAIGRIGLALEAVQVQVTPLHAQTRQLVRWASVIGLLLSLVVGGLFVWRSGDWLGAALAAITLAMALLPQEFLLILTVFMAMGAWRLSQQRVLTRRAATIEALGSATVLCTDKTGTLTHNRMAVAALVRWDARGPSTWRAGTEAPPSAFSPLLCHALLASEPAPADPMERALHEAARAQGMRMPEGWRLVHEYGLSPGAPMMTHVWQSPDAALHTVAVKGAPETVVALCGLPQAQRAQALVQTAALAESGMRVLAVARARWEGDAWPARPQDFEFEWLGLVALADPLRSQVPQAVQDLRRAGIRVRMITGDHPGTALAIARQAGLDTEGGVLLGEDIAALSDEALQQRVATVAVYARVAPQQKLRIIQALKARGEVVAMTGDGVNDAPSLKAAHIGVAMGGRGTDVAREASSLVLLDDDFVSLVQAVRLGRRIYDNLRKAMRFVFAVHVPIAGLSLLPLLMGWPLVFSPMHIAFLEIVIDPVCSIAYEAEDEEPDVMDRPPRDPLAPLFSAAMIGQSLLQGLIVLALVAGFYAWLLHGGQSAESARTAAFMALLASNIALVLANRSLAGGWRQALRPGNRAMWSMLLLSLGLLALVISVPVLREFFGFVWPQMVWVGAALALGLLAFLLLLVLQRWSNGRLRA